MTGGGRSTLRQAHWGLADQALSTGTNFLLSFMVVRSVSAADFGAFSLAYVLFMLAVGAVRATGGDVLTIAHLNEEGGFLPATRHNATHALGLGALFGAGGLVAATWAGGSLRPTLVVLSFALPLLLLQDALRSTFFALSRPAQATLNDALWTLLQFGALTPVLFLGQHWPVWAFLAAWAGGGSVAALVGLAQARLLPARVAPHRWLVTHRHLAAPLLANFLLSQLPAHLLYVLMPLVADLTELGVVRAAYVFFGPLGVVFGGAAMLALPEAVRSREIPGVRRMAARLSLGLAAVGLAWGALVLLLPDAVGRLLIGDIWDATLLPRLLLAGSLVAQGAYVGAWAALNALRLPTRMMRVWLVAGPFTLLAGLGLSWAFGAPGAAAGFLLGYTLSTVLAWLQVPRVALPDPGTRPADDAGVGVTAPAGSGADATREPGDA